MRDDGNLRGQGSFQPHAGRSLWRRAAREPEERQRALEILIAAYWKPVYKYIRLRWDKDNEQAQDLTQDFFFRLLEKDFLAQLRSAAGPFADFSAGVRGPSDRQ